MQQRNFNLDVIRCVAVIHILCSHFLLHANFYFSGPVIGPAMEISLILRQAFHSCVPIFLMLSGYLMNRKTLSLKYYKGISKILILYGLSCIPIWICRTIYENAIYTLGGLFHSFVNFEFYSWYIGMYICLYLLIPFLNKMYHQLESKQNKMILIGTLILLTSMPSLLNHYGVALIPTYFESFYPLTYYFMGAFLFEYADDVKLTALPLFLLHVTVLIGGGLFILSQVRGQYYYDVALFVDHGHLLNVCSTPLLFLTILKSDYSKVPKPICKLVQTISLVSLQLYLVSYAFDVRVYTEFNEQYWGGYADRFLRFPIPVFKVFIYSFITALIIQFIYDQIKKIGCHKI